MPVVKGKQKAKTVKKLSKPGWRNHKTALVIVVIVAIIGVAATLISNAATPDDIKVVSLNVCGFKCNGGKPPLVSALIQDVALKQDADVIGVQEVCFDQFNSARAALGPHGYQARMTVAIRNSACGKANTNAAQYGNAIYFKTPTVQLDEKGYTLPNPLGGSIQDRKLTCLSAPIKGRWVRICNTHLSYEPKNRSAQMTKVLSIVKAETSKRLILTGDFNILASEPGAKKLLAPYYAYFKEAPPADNADKVDYIFTNLYPSNGYRVADPAGRTDHKIFSSTVNFYPLP